MAFLPISRLQNSRIFCEASDGLSDDPYSNERSGTSVKTARENGERRCGRVRLARFTLEGYAPSVACVAWRFLSEETALLSLEK